MNKNSLKNLKRTTAPDAPGDTQAITVRVKREDYDWMQTISISNSNIIRNALREYRGNLSQVLYDCFLSRMDSVECDEEGFPVKPGAFYDLVMQIVADFQLDPDDDDAQKFFEKIGQSYHID